MSYYLFLDDERKPRDVTWTKIPDVMWIIARSYDDFVRIIRDNGLPIHVSFDHDMAPEHYPKGPQTGKEVIPYNSFKEKTGYHCANWLADYCIMNKFKLPQWTVHSHSISGKRNIINLLNNVERIQAK